MEPTGPIIGLLPGAEFREGRDIMAVGDVLVAFTDGLAEAEDQAGAELGDEAIIKSVRESPGAAAIEIFEKILALAFGHIKEKGFGDDVTLMVIRRCG